MLIFENLVVTATENVSEAVGEDAAPISFSENVVEAAVENSVVTVAGEMAQNVVGNIVGTERDGNNTQYCPFSRTKNPPFARRGRPDSLLVDMFTNTIKKQRHNCTHQLLMFLSFVLLFFIMNLSLRYFIFI